MSIAANLAWIGHGGGRESPYVFAVVAAGLIVWAAVRERARTRQIRQFAESRNLAYIGATMPVSFRLDGTKAFASAGSLRRAVVGSNGPKELVLVDCFIGTGRRNRARTIVAVRGLRDGFGWARNGLDLCSEELGEWSLVYSSNRYMSIEEIDALVAVFSEPSVVHT